MHVRITEEGFWLLKHRELASKVLDEIHNRHTDFLNGVKIQVKTNDASVIVTMASQLADSNEDSETKKKCD